MDEKIDEMKWPTRYRRNPIRCILCNEPTYEQKAICEDCRKLYELGQRAKEASKNLEGEKLRFWFATSAYIRVDFRHEIRLSELLTVFSGEPELGWDREDNPDKAFDEGRYLSDLSTHQNGRPNMDGRGGFNSVSYSSIMLTAEQGEFIKKFWQELKDAVIYARKEGERDGSHFLRRMAEGDLSIDQINAWHKKAEG